MDIRKSMLNLGGDLDHDADFVMINDLILAKKCSCINA